NASECWSATPLEAVSLPWPEESETVESIAPLPGLRELSLGELYYDPTEVDRLAAAPLLSTLRVLNAGSCNLGVEGFRRLTASPHMGNLTTLRVPSNYIGNGGVDALINAASLTSLAELDLSNDEDPGRYNEDPIIDESGLTALASWPGLAGLRSL